jgi:hypothetical protein
MRINRAVGLIIFLLAAHVILGGVFESVSSAVIASMGTVETASDVATLQLQKIH